MELCDKKNSEETSSQKFKYDRFANLWHEISPDVLTCHQNQSIRQSGIFEVSFKVEIILRRYYTPLPFLELGEY